MATYYVDLEASGFSHLGTTGDPWSFVDWDTYFADNNEYRVRGKVLLSTGFRHPSNTGVVVKAWDILTYGPWRVDHQGNNFQLNGCVIEGAAMWNTGDPLFLDVRYCYFEFPGNPGIIYISSSSLLKGNTFLGTFALEPSRGGLAINNELSATATSCLWKATLGSVRARVANGVLTLNGCYTNGSDTTPNANNDFINYQGGSTSVVLGAGTLTGQTIPATIATSDSILVSDYNLVPGYGVGAEGSPWLPLSSFDTPPSIGGGPVLSTIGGSTIVSALSDPSYFDSTSKMRRVDVRYDHEAGRQKKVIIHMGLKGTAEWPLGAQDGTWQKTLITAYDYDGAMKSLDRAAIGSGEDIVL